MENAYLEVKNARFAYSEERIIFKDVTFAVNKGEIFTILGPNGAGKSTLLSCIGNLLKLNKGNIYLDGKDIKTLKNQQIAQCIGYVPQSQVRTYDFLVREYIAMGRAPYLKFGQSPSKADYAMVDAIMEELGIIHLADKYYTKMSGGECQQVLIARVLVQQPEIIILDEPANHLDYGNQIKMLKLLKNLAAQGYGIILTSHAPDHALLLDSRIGILGRDGIMQLGNAKETLTEQCLSEIYDTKICKCFVNKADREACIPYSL